MKIRKFRGVEFINRDKELEFLKERVKEAPREILWLYGPKSTGKTSLIEYFLENELDNSYWIKFISFRRNIIANYENFIYSFFEESEEKEEELKATINTGIFKLEAKKLQKVKERKLNLFNQLLQELSKIKKQKIIVIDEIQALEDIYIEENKELLKEFLNFCIALTKETHLAHVIILSSNTVFIEKIYSDAKMKVTSEFVKVEHMSYETTKEYLQIKGFNDDEISLIWEYLGGCIPLIKKMLKKYKKFNSLKEYLEYQIKVSFSEIREIERRFLDDKKRKIFEEIAKIIIKDGEYLVKKDDSLDVVETIDFMAKQEIFFYDPFEGYVVGNNRTYEKVFELL